MSSVNFQACKGSLALSSQSSSSSIKFLSGFIPVNGAGRIYRSSNLSNSHSPSRLIHGAFFHLRLPFSQNMPIIPPQHKIVILVLNNKFMFSLKPSGNSEDGMCLILVFDIIFIIRERPRFGGLALCTNSSSKAVIRS